jgi:hypothetical protein
LEWPGFAGGCRGPQVIPEHLCHEIMRAAGLPVAAGGLACNEEEAIRLALAAGFPVAMKGISPAVTHRAAAGLVLLYVQDAEGVQRGFSQLTGRTAELGVELEGVYVQAMHSGGLEMLLAASRDPLFGPTVSCGSGGVLTELIDDVVTRRAPIGVEGAAAMVEGLRIRRHARDRDGPLPTRELAGFIAAFSELAAAAPYRRFTLEANPVKWSRAEVLAVDGLLVIEEG